MSETTDAIKVNANGKLIVLSVQSGESTTTTPNGTETTAATAAATLTKQPIMETTATTTFSKNPAREKTLTTFKANNHKSNINNNNNYSHSQKPSSSLSSSIIKLTDRNSLESINSKFSISSANDDSSQQHSHPQSLTPPPLTGPGSNGVIRTLHTQQQQQLHLHQQHSAGKPQLALVETRYVSPPVVPPLLPLASSGVDNQADDQWLQKSRDTSSSLEERQEQLVAMMSLSNTDYNIYKSNINSKNFQDSKFKLQSADHVNRQTIGQNHNNIKSHKSPLRSNRDGRAPIGGSTGGSNGAPPPSPGEANLRLSIVTLPDSKNTTTSTPAGNGPPFMFAGIASSIAGSVFFSLSVLCVKLLPDSDSFQEKAKVLFFRGAFMMLLCGSAIICRSSTFIVRRDELWVNILRAVFGTAGVFGSYCALSYISMGDSTALVFSSPIWTSILSHFILGEPLQWLQLIALPASLFGIILIAHPALIVNVDHLSLIPSHHHSMLRPQPNITTTLVPEIHNNSLSLLDNVAAHIPLILPDTTNDSFDFEHRWPGIAIALLTSLFVSCSYIVLKFRKKTPIQTTTFWFGVAMVLTSIAIMCGIGFGGIPSTFYEWSLLFGNGITSWLGQCFLQWAFLHEEAGVLSIVRTLDVAMTFALSALFLDEDIFWTSIVGATIIGLVVASIMLNNWIQKLTCMTENSQQVSSAASSKMVSNHDPSKIPIPSITTNELRSSPYIIAKND